MVEAIVASEVAARRAEDHDIDQQNLANRIAAGVNRAVVPAINAALTSITRASR